MAADDTKGTPPAEATLSEKYKGKIGELSGKGELLKEELHDSHSAVADAKAALASAADADKPTLQKGLADAEAALKKAGGENFTKLGFTQKIGARISGNWGASGVWKKGTRVVGTSLGVVIFGKGVKDLIAPSRDEEGNRQTSVPVAFVETLGGAAIFALSSLWGGAHNAMGIGRA